MYNEIKLAIGEGAESSDQAEKASVPRRENGSQTGGATSQTIEKLKGESQAIKSGKAANARLTKAK